MNIKFIADNIGLDYEQALEYVGGDIGGLKDKLMHLEEDSHFKELEAAIEKNNAEAIAQTAHKARKTFERVCLNNLASLAGKVEETKNGSSVYRELKDEYDKVLRVLKENS